ncbi:MAG: cupin domain-containing protein [Planctomycetota bacterium]|nr:MAG: cupin domain-containing protein [Planctomycetota bacterium]
MTTAQEIIEFFNMRPLEKEGGYYIETYRAPEKITRLGLPVRYTGERAFATAILYLLTPDTCSSLHRLTSDEVWHFYLGDSVTMLQLHPDGSSNVVDLGSDITKGQRVQVTAPKDTWQGAFLKHGGKFALMGTTTAPGFEFDDFELGRREKLLEQYANRRDLILKLTKQRDQ